MFFGFFRKLRRGILFVVLVLAATAVLQSRYPQLGTQIGQWISGAKDSPVVRAVSSMVESLSNGDNVKTAVEVFCENFENP